MDRKYDYLKDIDVKIKLIEKTAKELMSISKEKEIPAIHSNSKRILASAKMLKIGISDILDFEI